MKRILIAASAAALLLCGCKKSNPDPTPTPPSADQVKIPITLSTSIGTKATDAAFEADDRVGIYAVNYIDGTAGTLSNSDNHLNNTRFTFDGHKWNPDSPVYWKDEKTPADFYCYYPHTDYIEDVSSHPISVHTNQNDLSYYKMSDFLWGKTTGAQPSTDPVSITVKHAMSNLIIYIKPGEGYTEEILENEEISVTIAGVKVSGRINLATGQVTAEGNSEDVTPYKENGYWRALVIPQDIVGTELIRVRVGDRDFSLIQTISFKSNKQHKCTVTVNRIGEGVNIGIGGWEVDDTDFGGTLN